MTALLAAGGGLPLALRIPQVVEQIGSLAGFAAVVGLAILTALYISAARDLRRLREWAGRAPERSLEQAGRPIQAVPAPAAPRVVQKLPQAPAAAAPPAAPGADAPAPAQAQAAGDNGARADQPQKEGEEKDETATAAAGDGAAPSPEPDQAAGQKSDGDAAPRPAGMPAPASAAAAAAGAAAASVSGPAAPEASAPAAPAKPGGPEAPEPSPPKPGSGPDAPQPQPAKPASPGPAAPAKPATPSPAAPGAASPRPPGSVLPPRAPATQVRRIPSGTGPARPTAGSVASAAEPPKRKRNPVYVALAVVGVLILGAGAAIGVPQLVEGKKTSSSATNASGDRERAATRTQRAAAPADTKSITVAVLNGTTVPGLAAQIGDRVESSGFTLGTVDNAVGPQRANSVAKYSRGHQADARLVARRLRIDNIEPMDASSQGIAGDASVVVVVGSDQTR